MQDEVNEKCISVSVETSKMTARALKDALAKVLTELAKEETVTAETKDKGAVYQGKIKIKDLASKGGELSNIEITDRNIRSFEKCARKYGVTYSLRKDKSRDPPRYIVFFKAKQLSQMEAAFKEYTANSMEKSKKPSVRKRLHKMIEKAASMPGREKHKEKERNDAR